MQEYKSFSSTANRIDLASSEALNNLNQIKNREQFVIRLDAKSFNQNLFVQKIFSDIDVSNFNFLSTVIQLSGVDEKTVFNLSFFPVYTYIPDVQPNTPTGRVATSLLWEKIDDNTFIVYASFSANMQDVDHTDLPVFVDIYLTYRNNQRFQNV